MKFTPNRNEKYFVENQIDTNCGSFALNIEEWYGPDEGYDKDDIDMTIELEEEGFEDNEILLYLFKRNVKQIIKDFNVRRVCKNCVPKKDEELIAFRQCLTRNCYSTTVDYHFRVKRHGKWMEKIGCGPVREVDNYDEEPWVITEDLTYTGPVAYFIKKVN